MIDPQTIKLLEILSSPAYSFLFFLLMIWSLCWKGVALWKSSKNNQRNWFIALLIMNTAGILEIVYIFYFQRKEAKIVENKL